MLSRRKIFFILLLIPFIVFGDDSNDKKNKNWNASAFISYSLSKGNSEGKTYSGQAHYNYDVKYYALGVSYEQYYGKNKDIVNINKGKALLTFNRTIKNRLNISSSFIYEYDKIASLAYRFNYGLGLSYSDRDNKKNSLILTSNLVYEITHYNSGIKEDKKSVRFLLLAQSKIEIVKSSIWESSVSYTPNITNPYIDYRIEIKSSVKFLINAPLWFKFSILNQYNNNPPSDTIRKNDFTMVVGIEVTV
jgi:hypothetical protein